MSCAIYQKGELPLWILTPTRIRLQFPNSTLFVEFLEYRIHHVVIKNPDAEIISILFSLRNTNAQN